MRITLTAIVGWAMLTAIVTLLTYAFLVGPILMRFHEVIK